MPRFYFTKKIQIETFTRPPRTNIGAIDTSKIRDWEPIPLAKMDAFIAHINSWAYSYNALSTDEQRLQSLKSIQVYINEFEAQFPLAYFKNASYAGLKTYIMSEFHKQYASMGFFNSLQNKVLSNLITFMSPHKASELMSILDKGNVASLAKLKKLYEKNDMSEEAVMFRNFLGTHQISILGGKNTKNFKVLRLSDGHTEVLKLNNNPNPININRKLKTQQSLKAKLPHVETEKLTFISELLYGQSLVNKTSRIEVVEFQPGENLWERCKNLYKAPQLLLQAGNIFEQMAQTFTEIEQAGLVFPDAKLTNWMIDSSEKISIVDTKSFMFAEQGTVNRGAKNQHYALTYTPGWDFPEVNDKQFNTFKSEPVHAYLLGKNLYYFLTQNEKAPSTNHQGDTFDFDYPIFNTKQGENYRFLIEKLVQPNPENRMSLAEASLYLKYYNQISELEKLRFGPKDEVMNKYLGDQKEKFEKGTLAQKQDIINEITNTITKLKSNEILVELKKIATEFRKEGVLTSFFSLGKNKKCARIEEAVCPLSIEDRCNTTNQVQFNKAIRELASHRGFFKDGVIYEVEGKIDEAKAAQAFKDFKSKLKTVLVEAPKEDKEQDQASQTPSGLT